MSLGTTWDQEQRDSRRRHWRCSLLSEANMEGYIHHQLLAIRDFNTTTNKSMRHKYQLRSEQAHDNSDSHL